MQVQTWVLGQHALQNLFLENVQVYLWDPVKEYKRFESHCADLNPLRCAVDHPLNAMEKEDCSCGCAYTLSSNPGHSEEAGSQLENLSSSLSPPTLLAGLEAGAGVDTSVFPPMQACSR